MWNVYSVKVYGHRGLPKAFDRFIKGEYPELAHLGCESEDYDYTMIHIFSTSDANMIEFLENFSSEIGVNPENTPIAITLLRRTSVEPKPLKIKSSPMHFDTPAIASACPVPTKIEIKSRVAQDSGGGVSVECERADHPQALKIEPKPQPIYSPYVPGVVMKPTVQFEGITATEDDIKAIIPDISGIDADEIIRMLSKVSCTNYERTIPEIGLLYQESLAEIPELANTVIPKGGIVDRSLESLDMIRDMIGDIKIKNDSLFGKMFAKKVCIDETKKKIGEQTKALKIHVIDLDKVTNHVNELMIKLNESKRGLLLHSNLIKVLKAKTTNSEKVLDSRFGSLYISLTIADQTKQLIDLKMKNIKSIITVIRDTLLTSIPSWFNQLEILEQMEVASAIDETLVQSLMNNQQEILKQLSINSKEKA
jgi:hypothetical protein